MRDWHAFVRSRLRLTDLVPAREARIVREIAVQLEDFYREAVASGLGESEADAHACRQITDWTRLAQDVRAADAVHARPALDRLADTHLARTGDEPGVLLMIGQMMRDARYSLRSWRAPRASPWLPSSPWRWASAPAAPSSAW